MTTLSDLEQMVGVIKHIGNGDPEAAHGNEDNLRGVALKMIRDNPTDSVLVEHAARIALSTDEIRFPRWCG